MARRSDHSREELRALALDATERLLSDSEVGVERVSARVIAKEIGYSAGTLYNIFESFDELLIQVAARTLERMLKEANAAVEFGDPRRSLMQLANFYYRFTRENDPAWQLVVRYQFQGAKRLPIWYLARVNRVLVTVERAIAPLFDDSRRRDRRQSALTLWSSMQGICTTARSAPRVEDAEAMVRTLSQDLVDHYVAGLKVMREHLSASSGQAA